MNPPPFENLGNPYGGEFPPIDPYYGQAPFYNYGPMNELSKN